MYSALHKEDIHTYREYGESEADAPATVRRFPLF